MNTREAARIIGCSPSHVRYLCRTRKLKAKKFPIKDGEGVTVGYTYSIDKDQAKQYKRVKETVGWPRGKPRG